MQRSTPRHRPRAQTSRGRRVRGKFLRTCVSVPGSAATLLRLTVSSDSRMHSTCRINRDLGSHKDDTAKVRDCASSKTERLVSMQTTQELSTKPRKQRKKSAGRVLRASPVVLSYVSRLIGERESFDAFLRRVFNLPNRKGISPGLFECWVLRSTGRIYTSEAKARGDAIFAAAKKGHTGHRIEQALHLRETL